MSEKLDRNRYILLATTYFQNAFIVFLSFRLIHSGSYGDGYDIALIKVNGKFSWSNDVQPACVPTNDQFSVIAIRPNYIYGWGYSSSGELSS